MSTPSKYAFQSPSVSSEKGAYRMRAPRSSRAGSSGLRYASDPSTHIHLPYRRTRRLFILVALLACAAVACFACAYWLLTTRYGHRPPLRIVSGDSDASSSTQDLDLVSAPWSNVSLDALDEPGHRLDMLRYDTTFTYLAYLPHSGLHNQRIALENALTLARLLNRTLLVPPARLGPKTLRYVRSSALAQMLQLSDKRQGRTHCGYIPVGVHTPDECLDYTAYTLVPWAWLVNFGPIEAQQTLIRVSNGSMAWIEEMLGVRPNEILHLPDTEPYEYQFVDTSAPAREGSKYLHTILIDRLVAAPERLIQLGTLFGSSRLRLRKHENRLLRGEIRRRMILANRALALAAEGIKESLGGTYMGVHVRVGDGRFQASARVNVRSVWWKLVRDLLGMDTQMALELERRVLSKLGQDGLDGEEMQGPPESVPDMASLRVSHPPLPPLEDAFWPKQPCRDRPYTSRHLRRLNVPVYVATDAVDGLDDPTLALLTNTFPCMFTLTSFVRETSHLDELWNGYDGVRLRPYLGPLVDGLVMGMGWGVVGTEGSTFSGYVVDVLWRELHGWQIVERG